MSKEKYTYTSYKLKNIFTKKIKYFVECEDNFNTQPSVSIYTINSISDKEADMAKFYNGDDILFLSPYSLRFILLGWVVIATKNTYPLKSYSYRPW